MLRILSALVSINIFLVSSALALDASVCGKPPTDVEEEVKNTLNADANLLRKLVGSAGFSAQIQTFRRNFYLDNTANGFSPELRYLQYQFCVIVMSDDTLSTSEKIRILGEANRELLLGPMNKFTESDPTLEKAAPADNVNDINSCSYEGMQSIRCKGILLNNDHNDKHLVALVSQTGGIRGTSYDKYGVAEAIDNNANTYKASSIRIGNQTSPSNGQLSFVLYPNLKTPFSIQFTVDDSNIDGFYRVTIPIVGDDLLWSISKENIKVEK